MSNDQHLRKVGPFDVLPIRDPAAVRLVNLLVGLAIFGIAIGLSIAADFGVNPWTTFHQGLSIHSPMTVGQATILVGALLLLSFPLLREPIGVGTMCNVIMIGLWTDLTLAVVPDLESLPLRLLAIVAAPVLIGVGSGLYIGAGLGPGPRDSIMTALERRGIKVWVARTAIEATALVIGALLGGSVGLGTIWMMASVGWWVQIFLRRFRLDVAV